MESLTDRAPQSARLADVTNGPRVSESGPSWGAVLLALISTAALFQLLAVFARTIPSPETRLMLLWLPVAMITGLIARLPSRWLPLLVLVQALSQATALQIAALELPSPWLWNGLLVIQSITVGLSLKSVSVRGFARPGDVLKMAAVILAVGAFTSALAVYLAGHLLELGPERGWVGQFATVFLWSTFWMVTTTPLILALRFRRDVSPRAVSQYSALLLLAIFCIPLVISQDTPWLQVLGAVLLLLALMLTGLSVGVALTSLSATAVALTWVGLAGWVSGLTPEATTVIQATLLMAVCLSAYATGTNWNIRENLDSLSIIAVGVVVAVLLGLAAAAQVTSTAAARGQGAILERETQELATIVRQRLNLDNPELLEQVLVQEAFNRSASLLAMVDERGRIATSSSPDARGKSIANDRLMAEAVQRRGFVAAVGSLPFFIVQEGFPVVAVGKPQYLALTPLSDDQYLLVASDFGALFTQSLAERVFPISAAVLLSLAVLFLIVSVALAWIRRAHRDAQALEQALVAEHDLSRQLEASEKEAVQLAQFRSDFLANMSHEIRTPMNGVIGMTDLLLSTNLDGAQRDYAKTIESSGQSLMRILNDVLDISKLEAGKVEMESVPVSPMELVEDVTALLAGAAISKNIEIQSFVKAGTPALVCGDPTRLSQILTNLAGNAVKFTEQGQVIVAVESLPGDAQDKPRLLFSVSDSGIGIPEDVRTSLFDPFTQADSSTTRRFGGSGLGLSIVRQLVELLQGELSVESEPGVGSTFRFSIEQLPCPADPAEGEPGDVGPIAAFRDKRVLVVEENPAIRDLLTATLVEWGMTPAEADSGRRALAILKRQTDNPFDVMIAERDLDAPDGQPLPRAIAQDLGSSMPPTVLLASSFSDAGGHEDLRAAGVITVVPKPYRQHQLRTALELALAVGLNPAGGPDRPSLRTDENDQSDGTSETSAKPHRPRVLVAEDNTVNQKLARTMLSKLDAECVLVSDGAKAVAATMSDSFDLVLMDCQMPALDGFAATRLIRQQEQDQRGSRRLPIVALTASAMESDLAACLEAGMDALVAKPLTITDLERVLRDWAPIPSDQTPCDQEGPAG